VLNDDESTFQTLSARNSLASKLLSSGGSQFFLPSRVLRGQLIWVVWRPRCRPQFL